MWHLTLFVAERVLKRSHERSASTFNLLRAFVFWDVRVPKIPSYKGKCKKTVPRFVEHWLQETGKFLGFVLKNLLIPCSSKHPSLQCRVVLKLVQAFEILFNNVGYWIRQTVFKSIFNSRLELSPQLFKQY